MIKLFRRLPLSVKLTLTGVVPLALLVYVSVQVAREKEETIGVIRSLQKEMNTSVIISDLSTQLHLERRYTFSFLNGNQTPEKLAVQQGRTDVTIGQLKHDLGSRFDDFTTYTLLSQLDSVRTLTGRRTLVPAQAMLYYSTLLMRLNNMSASSAESAPYLKSVGPDIAGHRILGQIANNLGQLRALVYSALLNQELSQQDLFAIENISSTITSQERELRAKATADVHHELRNAMRSPAGIYTSQGIRNIIRTRSLDRSTDAETWWSTSAKVVDNLKAAQSKLEAGMQLEIANIYRGELQERNIAIGLIAATILIVLLLIIASIRSITMVLSEIQQAAERLARGETGFRTEVETRDAIGSLAVSINQIEATNKQLSKAAESIGAGNFDVHVDARGESDTLGTAIIQMKTNLQAFNKEQQETAWIQTGIRRVNECLLGDKPLEALNQDAMNTLADYLHLELGLVYVSTDAETLQYCCGYAVSNPDVVPRYLRPGETLAGQAALSRELIHLENVPADFMKVSSGAGSTTAQHLLIVPLVYNKIVEGVMELASLKPISKAAVTLVEQVSANIATAIQTAKNKARLQELLEETQSQAEELQAQHSELEGLNSELEAQAQQLQASEEELRVQQEELLQANQELEERSSMLEEKNELIIRSNQEIQQKAEELALSTRYKSEFLANMSHELRTPLNSILLLSRLMFENEDNQLNQEQVEYAEIIQSSGKALLSLIDEILDLSKIEAGKMDLDYQAVSIDEVMRESRALFQPVAQEKNLDLQLIKATGVPDEIFTDKMRLGQILKNLLSNALKFTAEGSVRLIVQPSRTFNHLDFVVSDTGIGIPREKQDLVFEAFQQADGSTKRRYGGTGLGLSISRELSRLLGGKLTLESESGKGSTFTLTIPRERVMPAAAATEPTPAAQEPAPHNGHSHKEKTSFRVPEIPTPVEDDRADIRPGDQVILIIEDDTAFATALLKFSRQKGFKGIISVRGDEGMQMARDFKPTAILLDIKLPVKDGWEVMDELKSDPATRHIPVHIMSSVESKKQSLQMGAVDFVSKPVGMDEMHHIFTKLNDVFTRNPKKVLIVEENTKHAQALHYFLSNFNVSTKIRGNMEDGMEALTREDVDCVILDMGIPDQHSYKTLEILKQSSGLENLPIIVFTGKSLSLTEESRIRQYADTIVLKTAQSYQRILDEVALFLHLVEEETPKKKASGFSLGGLSEVLQGKKVLIADDDVRNIFSLTKALEAHKMIVLSATDGQEALKVLEENPDTDVVLMDMMMPAMDGYETIQRIRQDSRHKNLPILAVTAKAMMGDRQKCIDAGASDYISKPVDIDQLVSLLRVWLYDKGI